MFKSPIDGTKQQIKQRILRIAAEVDQMKTMSFVLKDKFDLFTVKAFMVLKIQLLLVRRTEMTSTV